MIWRQIKNNLNQIIFFLGTAVMAILLKGRDNGPTDLLIGVLVLFVVSFLREKVFFLLGVLLAIALAGLYTSRATYSEYFFSVTMYLILFNLIFVLAEKLIEGVILMKKVKNEEEK